MTFANTLTWSFKCVTVCAKEPRKTWNKSNNTSCINSHYSVERERKIIAVITACLTYRIPQRAAVFLQHQQPELQPVCSIYLQLLTNPKRQVISFPQRTLSSLGREEAKGSHSSSFSSSLIWLVLPVVHSSNPLSICGIIWV